MSGIVEAYEDKPVKKARGYEDIINATGQIVKLGDKFEITERFCSGFKITDNLFLTAGHCMTDNNACYTTVFPNAPDWKNVWVNFGYALSSPAEKSARTRSTKSRRRTEFVRGPIFKASFVAQGYCTTEQIDYGVVTLTNKGYFPVYGRYNSSTPSVNLYNYPSVTLGEAIPVIYGSVVTAHHPVLFGSNGEPKKFSWGAILNQKDTSNSNLIVHNAPIGYASSGSPLADAKSKVVFGVNVEADDDPIIDPLAQPTYALPIESIFEVAETKKQPWVKKLTLKRSSPKPVDSSLLTPESESDSSPKEEKEGSIDELIDRYLQLKFFIHQNSRFVKRMEEVAKSYIPTKEAKQNVDFLLSQSHFTNYVKSPDLLVSRLGDSDSTEVGVDSPIPTLSRTSTSRDRARLETSASRISSQGYRKRSEGYVQEEFEDTRSSGRYSMTKGYSKYWR